MVIPFPRIPPVLVQIGPIAIRWYSLMYVVGYVVGYRLALRRIASGRAGLTRELLDKLLFYLVTGMLVGARIVYVVVYDPAEYRAHPLEVFALWKGGLSFHGAVIGMAAACWLFARRYDIPLLRVTDTVAFCGAPGLFFGRIGNFINGELYGRPTDVPWAMVFPADPLGLPRHPSQLYEAVSEGVLLFLVLWYVDQRSYKHGWTKPGLLTGTFLLGYAIVRFLLEFTRQPDAQLGFVVGPFSMGQLLSLTMLLVGLILLVNVYHRTSPAASP